METKELNIVAPEGYEIDKENSTLERIVFKKKDDKPRTWEEFCEHGFTGKEWCVTTCGPAKACPKKDGHRCMPDVGYVDNMEEAKAFAALMQLRQLRKAWVGDWEPDWKDYNCKYVIDFDYDKVQIDVNTHISRVLSFPTEEMAEEFVICFKNLLEIAKILL